MVHCKPFVQIQTVYLWICTAYLFLPNVLSMLVLVNDKTQQRQKQAEMVTCVYKDLESTKFIECYYQEQYLILLFYYVIFALSSLELIRI